MGIYTLQTCCTPYRLLLTIQEYIGSLKVEIVWQGLKSRGDSWLRLAD